MTEHAYIKLVPYPERTTVTLDTIKELLHDYQNITSKTGKQVNWNYHEAAFPYEIKEPTPPTNNMIYLQSLTDGYHLILIGMDQEQIHEKENERIQTYIQITLVEHSTFGDKGKANELCKFLAKQLKGELHLFNKRIMYFYPRK
ncbi:DUF1885 family protein [Peribacillus asahii]|uniref:DUF1885 family protein n=1 Tax=Peribacillus asahii TaxID=228899 RepID=A0A398BCU5_9BACI|nr:DUF1885 family protein [Peribacillus asahii]RID87637.1 DUF1885 family protein [Peribacillus asahii]